ncbi:hypothetical protein AAFF_G00073900 [Aldrovandia affinis]|uniref:Uncharacterized protein n=1 Tax=Aldrovandia affinis TaxID=143900 RepID=A0AAD7RYF2_9TELE|nr:hypothetical protein AAFF_G00073900 [Aldrovandia affinis]
MPPLHLNGSQEHGPQSHNGMEWLNSGQNEEVLLPAALIILWILLVLQARWGTLMRVLQRRAHAAETPLSVEETQPELGPYKPTYN